MSSGRYNESILRAVRKMINDTLRRFNPFAGDHPITVPGAALPPPEESPYAPAGAAFDARFLWGRPLQEGAPADGDAYLWDEDAEAFVLGAAAGGGDGTAAAFKAYLSTNTAAAAAAVLPMGSETYDLGGFYDPATYTWTPPPGPVAFMLRTKLADNSGDISVQIRKNGAIVFAKEGGRYSVGGQAMMEAPYLDQANGSDAFQLWAENISASGSLVAVATFWAGMCAGGGGGGGTGTLTGDVTTAGSVATVRGLQGLPITTAPPSDGEFLVWSASAGKLVWRTGELTTPTDAVTSGGIVVTSGGEIVIHTP